MLLVSAQLLTICIVDKFGFIESTSTLFNTIIAKSAFFFGEHATESERFLIVIGS